MRFLVIQLHSKTKPLLSSCSHIMLPLSRVTFTFSLLFYPLSHSVYHQKNSFLFSIITVFKCFYFYVRICCRCNTLHWNCHALKKWTCGFLLFLFKYMHTLTLWLYIAVLFFKHSFSPIHARKQNEACYFKPGLVQPKFATTGVSRF